MRTGSLLLVLLMVAIGVHAQLPAYKGPDLKDQLEKILDDNRRLDAQTRSLKADVFSCDSVLKLTRSDFDELIAEHKKKVERLTTAANDSVKAEFNRRKETTTAFDTLLIGLADLERQETDEALLNRLFGSGRKRAAKARRDFIIQLRAKVTQR